MALRATQAKISPLNGRRLALGDVSALAPWNYIAVWTFPAGTPANEIRRVVSQWTHHVNRDGYGHRYYKAGRGFLRAVACGPTPSERIGVCMLCQIPRRGIGAALQGVLPRTIPVDRPVADLIPEHFRSALWILEGDTEDRRRG